MNEIVNFALNLLQKNPNVSNNPRFKEYIEVIRSGDSARGQEIANNICKSYGTTPQDGYQKARNFFHM